MVGIRSTAALGSAMFGLASAAGAGSKAEYESGAVHARIMGIKMVSSPDRTTFTGSLLTLPRLNGRPRVPLAS